MNKILTQPNDQERANEVYRQIEVILAENVGHEIEILSGVASSQTLHLLNIGEFVNNFVQTFNLFVAMANAPFQMLEFPDWLETKDMSVKDRERWVADKNKKFQERRKKIIIPS